MVVIKAIVIVLLVAQLHLLLVALAGLAPRRRYGLKGPRRRFLVLVPAHNEQAVIARSVTSALAQDYRGPWRVVVIADRCADHTAAIARDLGAEVWERWDGHPGKQHAIRWALDQAQSDAWDALAVLDADNRASLNMLAALDAALTQRAAAQVYLDTLNPWDSDVTAGYAAMYLQANVFAQRARDRLGLSALLGGTGFAITRDALAAAGWPTRTAVDDLELTARLVLAGQRAAFTEEARVWDEKPRTWRASLRQRVRWMRGHAQAALAYGPLLAGRVLTRADLVAWDMLAVLFMPLLVGISLALLPFEGAGVPSWFFNMALFTGLAILASRRHPREGLLALALPLFSLSWLPAIAWGFLTVRSGAWEKTAHGE